jgi:tRNA (guanine37-N1)-methyltransferase
MVDLELSIGDYVLSGGEIPALVFVDTILRLLPGRDRRRVHDGGVVHGRAARVSAVHAPAGVRGVTVPAVLTSGHHEAVRKWRLKESLRRT